jgi:hypothetical protein
MRRGHHAHDREGQEGSSRLGVGGRHRVGGGGDRGHGLAHPRSRGRRGQLEAVERAIGVRQMGELLDRALERAPSKASPTFTNRAQIFFFHFVSESFL